MSHIKKSLTTRIGIVGGGQLGRMLTIAAKQLGFTVIVIDPTPQSPAGQVADKQIIGGYKDAQATKALAKEVDVITIDAEFVNDTALEQLVKKGTLVYPSVETITMIKDKLQQKTFLKKHSLPVAPFKDVSTKEDIILAAKTFKYPLLLKARTDAYDGKGNFVIKTKNDIENGLTKLAGRSLYVEQHIPFVKELAVMVARNIQGDIAVYPVVETVHKDNICDLVSAPAPISKKAYKNAQALGKKIMTTVKGAGIFGIEMFLLKNDTVIINEIAPRVHNSGHYTIEASVTSQFEQHIRAITGLPLGATDMITPAVVMKNILGEKNGNGFPIGIEKALAIPHVSLHMYGKHESRIGRKMGHITVIGKDVKTCVKKAEKARRYLVV